jgi:hypothetical protein
MLFFNPCLFFVEAEPRLVPIAAGEVRGRSMYSLSEPIDITLKLLLVGMLAMELERISGNA